jgi:hypothetical protein
MTEERRRALRRTYVRLGAGELAAAVVFVVLAGGVVAPGLEERGDAAALWFALAPLLVVLVQAGTYWLLARSWVGRRSMPAGVAIVYRVLRIVDVVLIAAGLAGMLVWWPDQVGAALAMLAVWVFGVIEYLNYFVVRLAYPARRWPTQVLEWRTPRLVLDLDSASRSSGSRAQ